MFQKICGVHLCNRSQDGEGDAICFVSFMVSYDGGLNEDALMATFEERLSRESIQTKTGFCKLSSFFTFEL